MDRPISRRDFLDGVAVTALATLAPGHTGSSAESAAASPAGSREAAEAAGYPPEWQGLQGSTPDAMAVPHALRDHRFWQHAGTPEPTGERYDLVVVGAGISGITAAHRWWTRDPRARILVLDNHDDFGGRARRNEFRPAGREHPLIGYGGPPFLRTSSALPPETADLLAALGVGAGAPTGRALYRDLGMRDGVFCDRETFGADRLVVFRPGWIAGLPMTPESKRELSLLFSNPPDWFPGAGEEEKKARLASLTYAEFLRDVCRARPEVIRFCHTMPARARARHSDALTALDAWSMADDHSFPGFAGLGRAEPPEDRRRDRSSAAGPSGDGSPVAGRSVAGLSARGPSRDDPSSGSRSRDGSSWGGSSWGGSSWSGSSWSGSSSGRPPGDASDVQLFPDGNHGLIRMMIRRMIPGVAPGRSADDITLARFDYDRLDRPENRVRVRLSSPVVLVRNDGAPDAAASATVGYFDGEAVRTVRAAAVVLACWHGVIPYLVPDLPEDQGAALRRAVRAPVVYATAQLRDWRSWCRAGVDRVRFTGAYWADVQLAPRLKAGSYRCPADPAEPITAHLVRLAAKPGMAPGEGAVAGRHELIAVPYRHLEHTVRDQLARLLGPSGFDPARDIEGLTINRWAHGLPMEPGPPSAADGPAPAEVARRRFGRIAIAGSDSAPGPAADTAIGSAYRAVDELHA